MAELALSPVAAKVIEKVIEKIIDACSEYLKDQVRWQRGLKEELQKLVNILPQIQAVVSAHSQREIKDEALNKWYWQLRDAIDEADDVVDEIEYRKLQKQANTNTGKVRSLMKSIKKRVVKISKRAIKIDSYLKRLEVTVQKLNEVLSRVGTFRDLLKEENQKQEQQQLELHETRETGSTPVNVLLGRSKEMEFIRQWLRNSYETQNTDTNHDLYISISALSVVGLGGMGKTTLLQHVYNDATLLQDVNKDGITDQGFHVKMWACVSTNFVAQTVIKNILESLKKEKPQQETIESLQTSLQSEVKNKRFLLVLDDIWEASEEKWKNVFAALKNGNPGSKILISTRMFSVASTFAKMFKNNQFLKLEGLEKDGCLQLFNKHAFAGRENPGGKFRVIAENMVERLSRCPLAIMFIGNFLNTCLDETFWTNVLNTDIGKLKPEEPSKNFLLPILKLSYTHLPCHLQNCFSFCCIFPQDHEFDKDDLVRMWIALGFIQPSDISEETLENTGRRYFNILVQKSFFDEFHTHDHRMYYKMHDLLHDLAQSISIQECFRVVSDKKLSIPETIRHLSIDTPSLEVLKEIEKLKHLRSLFMSFSEVAEFDENVTSQILKTSENIRLLVINAPYINYSVPEMVNHLIHLRYLKVDGVVLKLSRSISHLYHLQFVICDRLENLVMGNIGWEKLRPNKDCHLIMMGELVIKDLNSVLLMEPQRSISYLRFLTIENNDDLVSFPTETELWLLQHSSTLLQLTLTNLKSLQSLPSLLTFSFLTYLKLLNIPLLKSLPDLPSSLKTLVLCELNSLESLQPSSLSAIPSLETLILKQIPLKSLPVLPSSLKILEVIEFKSLKSLPSSLSVIHSLKSLVLRWIPHLKSLPYLPSSLESLTLIKLQNLVFLPSCLPTHLLQLRIYVVRRLLELPDLPSSLELLDIDECDPQLMERCEIFRKRRWRRYG